MSHELSRVLDANKGADMSRKLNGGELNLIRLAIKGAQEDGWAPVSAPVYPLVHKLPAELVELQPVGNEGRGRIRLTRAGENLINAMRWL